MWLAEPLSSPAPHFDGHLSASGGGLQDCALAAEKEAMNVRKVSVINRILLPPYRLPAWIFFRAAQIANAASGEYYAKSKRLTESTTERKKGRATNGAPLPENPAATSGQSDSLRHSL